MAPTAASRSIYNNIGRPVCPETGLLISGGVDLSDNIFLFFFSFLCDYFVRTLAVFEDKKNLVL